MAQCPTDTHITASVPLAAQFAPQLPGVMFTFAPTTLKIGGERGDRGLVLWGISRRKVVEVPIARDGLPMQMQGGSDMARAFPSSRARFDPGEYLLPIGGRLLGWSHRWGRDG